jgi:uncharacterized protein YyaL (SSP411 family)
MEIKRLSEVSVPSVSEFILQYHYLTGDKNALNAVTNTLTKMALGGIYDHIGGGFADIPLTVYGKYRILKKMLYDNAQLISLYAHAYQATGNNFFKTIAQKLYSSLKGS